MAGYLIGEVATRTGLTVPTIRYYERIGLVQPPARSATGYRRYGDATVEELAFIRKAQALGFSLEEIAQILALSRAGTAPCEHVLDLARRHIAAVDDRIRQLTALREQLGAEIEKWRGTRQSECGGLCPIIATADTPIADIPSTSLRSRSERGAPPPPMRGRKT